MPTQYNGIASRITLPGTLTIASMSGSGTNPTLVTFTTPHGLTTGDTIDLFNIDGNTAGNGTWPATVTSGSQISIPVTGNGTYTGILPGQGRPITFGSTFQVPSDGDLISASNNNAPPESLGDRSAVLLLATGAYKLVNINIQGANDPAVATTWGTVTSSTTSWTAGTSIALPAIPVQKNDFVEVSLTTAAALVSSGFVSVSIGMALFAPGTTGTFSKIAGSGSYLAQPNITALNLHGIVGVLSTGNVVFCVGQEVNSATSATTSLGGDHTFIFKLWRPTGVNQ